MAGGSLATAEKEASDVVNCAGPASKRRERVGAPNEVGRQERHIRPQATAIEDYKASNSCTYPTIAHATTLTYNTFYKMASGNYVGSHLLESQNIRKQGRRMLSSGR